MNLKPFWIIWAGSLIALMLLTWSPVHAETQVTFAWDYSASDEEYADGFAIYYADNPTPAAWLVAVPDIAKTLRTQAVVIVADLQCQYFIMRAFRGALESADSNMVEWCPIIPDPEPNEVDNFRLE